MQQGLQNEAQHRSTILQQELDQYFFDLVRPTELDALLSCPDEGFLPGTLGIGDGRYRALHANISWMRERYAHSPVMRDAVQRSSQYKSTFTSLLENTTSSMSVADEIAQRTGLQLRPDRSSPQYRKRLLDYVIEDVNGFLFARRRDHKWHEVPKLDGTQYAMLQAFDVYEEPQGMKWLREQIFKSKHHEASELLAQRAILADVLVERVADMYRTLRSAHEEPPRWLG